MPFDADITYHLDSAAEMRFKGYSPAYNEEMSALFVEKQDFYLANPTKRARKRARREGIKVGRWY